MHLGDPLRLPLPSRLRHRQRSQGQSLVEFVLIFPVLLLLLLIAIDFGRVFLGWVNLEQMTRAAAGYASEHASAWGTPGDAAERAEYQERVLGDARLINCDLPNPLPDPVMGSGTALGAPVTVSLSCQFSVITPVVSSILGGAVLVSAETTYPIRDGVVATVPGGGVPITDPPEADFVATPRSGWAPLEVTFVDASLGAPSSWTWDFSVGSIGGSGTGSVSPSTSLDQGPHTVTYDCAGVPGDTCVFSVSLQVGNAGGTDSVTRSTYITVTVPPATGPVAEFTVDPSTGEEPLAVDFDFVDLRGGTVTYTAWQWDFTNDGSFDATGTSASHTYPTPGSYDVRLRVTDSAGATQELVKVGAVVVTEKVCIVPDFANVRRNNAQSRWAAAGFTTTVQFRSGSGNYSIQFQSLVGGTINPQPGGCDASITVGP